MVFHQAIAALDNGDCDTNPEDVQGVQLAAGY